MPLSCLRRDPRDRSRRCKGRNTAAFPAPAGKVSVCWDWVVGLAGLELPTRPQDRRINVAEIRRKGRRSPLLRAPISRDDIGESFRGGQAGCPIVMLRSDARVSMVEQGAGEMG